MSPAFTRESAAKWMRAHVEEHRDGRTNEVNHTSLAEDCADAFGVAGWGGPLDDPDHWVWEVAVEVGT